MQLYEAFEIVGFDVMYDFYKYHITGNADTDEIINETLFDMFYMRYKYYHLCAETIPMWQDYLFARWNELILLYRDLLKIEWANGFSLLAGDTRTYSETYNSTGRDVLKHETRPEVQSGDIAIDNRFYDDANDNVHTVEGGRNYTDTRENRDYLNIINNYMTNSTNKFLDGLKKLFFTTWSM